jgi:hypothetical protein
MISFKYPKRPNFAPNRDADRFYYHKGYRSMVFHCGSAYAHAHYLIKMSFRHPIMYFLWYRWWIPFLLQEDERNVLPQHIKTLRKEDYGPYWSEFSIHHPVQYLLFLLFILCFQFLIQLLTTPVKIILRFCNFYRKNLTSPEYGIAGTDTTSEVDHVPSAPLNSASFLIL